MGYTIFAWIFSVGGILAFCTMIFHSLIFMQKNMTLFIFGGGTTIAYLLEYTLSNTFELYSYQNLPLDLYDIPLVIPCGWIISFYGLYHMSMDLTGSETKTILLTGLIGMLFGFGIEALAKESDFWVFHFESRELVGIPLNVILAWGLSTANFAWGITLFKKFTNNYSWIWLPILLLIHVVNIIIAVLLS